jgi:hypothetical protein
MKLLALSLLSLAAAGTAVADDVHGRYVEARTASVMAGACHYNGEVVTRGRDAILAFRFESGRQGGVDLTGVNAVAVLTSDENLLDAQAPRRSVLIIDSAASEAQAAAVADRMRQRHTATLGNVVSVRRAPVHFTEKDGQIQVEAEGFASLSVKALADRACCKMPHLVWYQPLVPVTDRQVGYTVEARSDVFTSWQDAGENTAFHGRF